MGGELEIAPTTEAKHGPKRYDRDTGDISANGTNTLESLQPGA